MDHRHPAAVDVLEELVSALWTSLTPITTLFAASVSPMALPACFVMWLSVAASCYKWLSSS